MHGVGGVPVPRSFLNDEQSLNYDLFYKKNAQKDIYKLYSIFFCDLQAMTMLFFFLVQALLILVKPMQK